MCASEKCLLQLKGQTEPEQRGPTQTKDVFYCKWETIDIFRKKKRHDHNDIYELFGHSVECIWKENNRLNKESGSRKELYILIPHIF